VPTSSVECPESPEPRATERRIRYSLGSSCSAACEEQQFCRSALVRGNGDKTRSRQGSDVTCARSFGVEQIAPGWTVARINELGGTAPDLLPIDTFVVANWPGASDYEVLQPLMILAWDDLCLVRCVDGWFMGTRDKRDGSIVCFSDYGDDFERALRDL
jgi:hypothetical protein